MTGHLVFSTLHTNDAVGAVPRLMDMGVAPYLLSSSLVGVLAQRLVRVICQECKVELTLEQAGAHRLGDAAKDVVRAFKGKGCGACNKTGYRGRMGVFELLITDAIRVTEYGTDPEALRRAAVAANALSPMLRDAVAKVNAGTTSVDEVIRSVFSEIGG
jgi:type II secretory ATPase GspE/PulE/Tfp pilus assembly ATPase PilB-like protein